MFFLEKVNFIAGHNVKRNKERRTPGSVQPSENKENEDFEINFIDKSIGNFFKYFCIHT